MKIYPVLRALKPHVRMIKFRYGERPTQQHPISSSGSGQRNKSSGPVLEDWQLPPRYQRRPLDSVEIEYINRGGPE